LLIADCRLPIYRTQSALASFAKKRSQTTQSEIGNHQSKILCTGGER